MSRRVLGDLLVMVAAFFIGLALLTVAMPGIGSAFDSMNPVIHSWRPTSVLQDGDDIVVSGTMVKARDCPFIAPPMARLETGQNVPIASTSPTAGMTWDNSEKPQRFGPWRIPGGARHHVTIYLRHQCHALWSTVTEVGVIPASSGP